LPRNVGLPEESGRSHRIEFMSDKYRKCRTISLRNHPEFNEAWLQKLITDDPELLGLGLLDVVAREKIQFGGGRLDLLMQDVDAGDRYEVELQLGPTDPSHIIRTIEYWDLERRRNPQLSHTAVIVAEQITSRFFNVISLFNRAIPIIAIQVQAIEVEGFLTLTFTKILDLSAVGEEDELQQVEPTDRSYWESAANADMLQLTDQMVALLEEVTQKSIQAKYNKNYVGLSFDGFVNNFVIFKPRKQVVVAEIRLPRTGLVDSIIADAELDQLPYSSRWGRYRVRIAKKTFEDSVSPLRELFIESWKNSAGIDSE